MKPDTERTKRYKSKLHTKKGFLHAHLGKDLRSKMKAKKRSLLVHKGDKVKIMRGGFRGKTGKISDVSYIHSKVTIEGITRKNLKAKEIPVPFDASNLLLLELEMTKERKELFTTIPTTTKVEKTDEVTKSEHVKVESPIAVEDQSEKKPKTVKSV
ncbi:MAG: 50S ribosomal protein L24 [Candidatus Micrarchaeota archaeon]|nr:50S ribosomal protein L24 [Candidatus Micrarchaeota archaeon]